MCKIADSSFSRSRDITGAQKNFKSVTPVLRVICPQYADTWYSLAYFRTKFEDCSFSHSRDMVAWCPPKFKLFTWVNHAPFRDVCDPWAGTCYHHPAYQIWTCRTSAAVTDMFGNWGLGRSGTDLVAGGCFSSKELSYAPMEPLGLPRS